MGFKASDLGNLFSGTSKDAGILGVGQFKANPVKVDKAAFGTTPEIDAQRKSFADALAASQGRTAPQMQAAQLASVDLANSTSLAPADTMQAAQIDQGQQAQFRGQQASLASALQAQANGQGPSLAQSQLQSATDRNLKQALAMQASQRGGNPAAGMRQAAISSAALNAGAARDSATLRMQEQMAARQQLGGVLTGARQQDIGLATDQAGLAQQASAANMGARNTFALNQGQLDQGVRFHNSDATNQRNLQQGQLTQGANINNQAASLQQTGLNDTNSRFLQGGLSDMAQSDRNAGMGYEKLLVDQNSQLAGTNQKAYAAAGLARGSAISGLGQAAAYMGLFKNAFGGAGGGGGGGGGGSSGSGGLTDGDGNPVGESGFDGGDNGTGTEGSSPDSSTNYSPTPGQGEPGNYVEQGSQNSVPEGAYLTSKNGSLANALRYSQGGKVPGRAPAKGDSKKNDVVHTMLSPGEIVIPRSVVGDDKKVLAFVRALREKHDFKESHDKKLAKVLGKKRSAS